MEKTNFFKDNKKNIFKLLTTHFVMCIFGLMVTMPWGMTKLGNIMVVVCSIFSILFYAYLIDLHIWDVGATDALNAASRGTKLDKLKGLKLALIVSIPTIIISGLLVFFSYYQTYEWAVNGHIILKYIEKTWDSMFLGIQSAFIPDADYPILFSWFYLLTPLYTMLVTGLSYYLGTKNIVIIPRPKRDKE